MYLIFSQKPFRKIQTSIRSTIKYSEQLNTNWEESMDKNFEYIAIMLKEKQKRKDENIQVNYTRQKLTVNHQGIISN